MSVPTLLVGALRKEMQGVLAVTLPCKRPAGGTEMSARENSKSATLTTIQTISPG